MDTNLGKTLFNPTYMAKKDVADIIKAMDLNKERGGNHLGLARWVQPNQRSP